MARVALWLGLVLAALVRADQRFVCTNTCSSSDDAKPGIKYEGGQQYTYQYHGQVIGKTRVTADEESKMSVKADVIITARTSCDLKLQVQNLILEDVPEEDSQWFKEAVEKYDLHYSYQDGWMEYLCPHEDEDVAATNFKRGILSALQSTVTNAYDGVDVVVQESDVSGECETRYQITGSGDLVFNKTKLNCNYNSYLPYIPHAQFTSKGGDNTDLPFFSNNKNCKMDLSNGVWKSVDCTEEISVIAPLSASSDASTMASMTITASLALQSGPEAAQGNFSEGRRDTRESLRMDLPGAIESSEARTSNVTDVMEQIESTIQELSGTTEEGEMDNRPYAFSNLLNLLGKVQEEEDMYDVWDQNTEDESRRKYLLDALMLCESRHCMNLLANVSLESPEALPAHLVKSWLTNTHFFANVHPDAINMTMNLVHNKESVKNHALMAASTMVFKVCQQDPNTCQSNAQIFLDYIEEQIGDSCGYGSDPETREDILLALRALANAGILPKNPFLRECYMNANAATKIRVSALQTYRRTGCPSDSKTLWKILGDHRDNVEVRLAAYLSLVPCAISDAKFFTRIENLLIADDVNQVGSYIWTHIQNLVNEPSSSKYRKQLSKLASHHTLQAKFNTNGFRSSRNYRYAHFSDIMNIGGAADSNVIFSPDSYIPRQASMNFTLEMLEKSINIFDFGGDFNNLETYVERLFGKDGYFKHDALQTLVENLRPKRDVREDKIKEFQRLYDEARTMNELDDDEMDEEARASFYLRVFGNEVFYVDNVMKTNPIQVIKSLVSEFSSPKSFKVVDQEYVSATQLGFPLRLKLNATASISFNHENTFEDKGNSKFVFKTKVSASAVFACDESLVVDGYGSWSGIKRSSSKMVHSDFGVRVERGDIQPLGVQVSLPKPEVAKITSTRNVALYKNTEQGWQDTFPNIPMEPQEYCSPELVSKILGIEMCVKSDVGKHTVGIETFQGEPYNNVYSLTKTDQFPYYQFYFKVEQNIFEAIYEAPGSSVQRKLHFLVNLGPDGTGGYIVIRGMGYGLKGKYQNTETLKELSLKYTEDSETKGGIEMSLESDAKDDGSDFQYIPKVILTVGPDIFTLEGKLDVNHQSTGFRSTWGLEGTHQKVEGRLAVGQSFGSVDGSVNINEEITSFQLSSKYGTDRAKAHSVNVNLDTTRVVKNGKKRSEGTLFLESTQGQSNLTLGYAYSPGDIQANGSVSILGKDVSSQIVMKNLNDEDGRDLQVTLSLLSPQFDIDYLGQAIYKVSDNAFQMEAALNLGAAVHTKAALTYVFEKDPLLFLTGVHLSYNEHLLQAEASVDLSQSERTHITLSGNAGLSKAGFLLQVLHAKSQPFNFTMSMRGNYDDQEVGLTTHVVSDDDWQYFTGSSKVTWFDDNFTLKHEVDWQSATKRFSLTAEDYGVLQMLTKMSPQNPFIQVLLHSTEEVTDDPDFQISLGMLIDDVYNLYQANITHGPNTFFATSTNLTRDPDIEFSSSLTYMESEFMITGQYNMADYEGFEASADIEVILPSKDVYSTNLTLNYTDDGSLTNLQMSSSYDSDVIESKLSILHEDGWFSDTLRGINFTLATPFDGLSSARFSFEINSDPTKPNTVILEWEDLQLHGLLQNDYPNNVETTMRYGDGGKCDSHFSIYHKTEDHQFTTGAILSLTQDMNPWSIEVNTTINQDYGGNSLGLDLSVQSPLLENVFEGNIRYNLTSTHFDFEIEVGLEEKLMLSLIGDDMEDGELNRFIGIIEMDSPWNEQVVLNISGNYGHENINIILDLKSTLPIIQSLTAETSVNFVGSEETKVNLQLTHDEAQILMSYHQKLSRYGMTHDLQGSVNSFTITYDLNTEWDYYYKLTKAEGKLALLNLFDHDLEISLSLEQESDRFLSKMSGSWDGDAFKLFHALDYKHPLQWSNNIEITAPAHTIAANVSLNAIVDLSQVDFKVYLNTHWTGMGKLKFTSITSDDGQTYEFDLLQDDSSLLKILFDKSAHFDKHVSHFNLEITPAFSENIKVSWKHDLKTKNLVSVELSYGTIFSLQGDSYLKFSGEWFEHKFEQYSFSTNITISEPKLLLAAMLNLNSEFSGDLFLQFDEYSASVESDIFDGTVFQLEAKIPDKTIKSELTYEKGRHLVPDIMFIIKLNDIDIINSKVKFNSVYPELDAIITFSHANEDNSTLNTGNLMISATLDYGYGIKGNAQLVSDFEGFENHTLSIDTKLLMKERQVEAFFNGHLQLNDLAYNVGINGTVLMDKKILVSLGASYDMTSSGMVDKKDTSILFAITRKYYSLKSTAILNQDSPPWELSLEYKIRDQKLNGYITLGDGKKYVVSVKLDSKILHINAEILEEDDSSYKLLQGNVNWNIRKEKQQINMNMNSDYLPIQKVTGRLTVRGLAATLQLAVNEEKATIQIRMIQGDTNTHSKIQISINNSIYSPFSTVVALTIELLNDMELKTDLTVDLNDEKNWITANLLIGLEDTYLKFKTPFEGFDNFNLTISVNRDIAYDVAIKLEIPQLCFDFKGVVDKSFRQSSFNATLNLDCSDAPGYEFIFEYNINRDNAYDVAIKLEIPQLCFDFKGVVDKSFRQSSFNATINLDCSDAPGYEFIFEYNIKSLKEPLRFFTKVDWNGSTVFEFDFVMKINDRNVSVKLEGQVIENYGIGITFEGFVKDKEGILSLNLQGYEPSSNTTHALFKLSVSKEETELQIELLQDNVISFKADYGISKNNLKLNSNYAHSLFGHSFRLNSTLDTTFDKKGGTLKVHITTDKYYDEIIFSASYDIKDDISEVIFILQTPTGNVTARGTYEITKTSNILIIDMLSDLHTFQDYHYEAVYKNEGFQSLKLLSAQDDVKFEFQGNVSRRNNILNLDLQISSSYDTFKSFNLTLGFPKSRRAENNLKLYISTLVNGDIYIIDFEMNHDSSWDTYSMKTSLFTPYAALRNITLDFAYSSSGQISLSLHSKRGRLGFDAIWNSLPPHLNIKSTIQLSYFNQGEYTIDAQIPFDINNEKGFKLTRQKSDSDFDLEVIMGENYKSGLFRLMMIDVYSDNGNTTYSLTYSFDNIISISGHFDKWEAMLGLEVYGDLSAFKAGKFEINTNVANYESFEGTWHIDKKGSVYKAEIQSDVNKKGLIIFDATLDTQSHSVATPWDSVKLDILFESPFTLSHHLHAEYQSRILTFSVSYKYGLDTFYVKGGANIHPSFGTISFMSRLPVYGFSSFDVKMRYTIAEQNSANIMISIEETTVEIGFELGSNGYDGSFRGFLISPYINPMGINLSWSNSYSAVFFEVQSYYGAVKGIIKMTLKHSENFVDFEIEIVPRILSYFTGITTPSSMFVIFKYDVSDPTKSYASVILTAGDHVIEAKGDISVRKEKVSLNFGGLANFYGHSANITLGAKKNKDSYEITIQGEVDGLKPFRIYMNKNAFQIHFLWNYDAAQILNSKLSYNSANVAFYWDKYNHFNLTGHSKSLKDGHEIGLDFINHDMQIVTLKASYLYMKAHIFKFAANSSWTEALTVRAAYQSNKINFKVSYGEKEYNVSTKFIFNRVDLKATMNVHFDSTDDPTNPISLNAFYDLKDILKGNMDSMKNISQISFEWGEKTELSIQGLRKPGYMKLALDMTSPLKYLPKLSIGAGWEVINTNRHFLLDFAGYIEWSKKIALDGLTKISKDLRVVDIRWNLNTPSSLLEELTFGIQWKAGFAETQFSYNHITWKLQCDYEFNPLSCTVTLQTPINGFETITFVLSVTKDSKLDIHAELSWSATNVIGIQINMEASKLEVGLITPWSPFKKVLFFTSLKTESEEARWSATLQWDNRRTEVSLTISHLRYEFSGKHFRETEEVVTIKAEFALSNREIHFEMELMTPYNVIQKIGVLFDLNRRDFIFNLNINDSKTTIEGLFTTENIQVKGKTPYLGNLSMAMDISLDLKEMAGFSIFSYSVDTTPVNVSFAYKHTEAIPFKFVLDITADESWVSVMIDLTNELSVKIDVFENYFELKLMLPSKKNIVIHVNFESKDLCLESMSFELNAKFESNFKFNIKSILRSKFKDQFVSRNELNINSDNSRKYILISVTLYSDYLADILELKISIPLFNILTQEGKAEVSLTEGGRPKFKLFYETVLPNRRSSSRYIKLEYNDMEANLKTIISSGSLNVSFSYPKLSVEHTFYLSWSEDFNPERFALAGEITSPYLGSGDYKFDLKFSFRGVTHMKLKSTLILGTKKMELKSQFNYNKSQRKAIFEIQVISDWFGEHSLGLSIDWENEIVVSGEIILLDKEHRARLIIDIEQYILELTISSHLLSQEDIIITGLMEQNASSYMFRGEYTTSQTKVTFNGSFKSTRDVYFEISANILHNGEKIFEVLSSSHFEEGKVDFTADIQSIIKEINTNIRLEHMETFGRRNFKFRFENAFFHIDEMALDIITVNNLLDNQEFLFTFNDVRIHLKSQLRADTSHLLCSVRYGYKIFEFTYNHKLFGQSSIISIETPFDVFQRFYIGYDISTVSKVATITYLRNGEEFEIGGYINEDLIIGKSISLVLKTPFQGYEKFALQSPAFSEVLSQPSFITFIEYPTGKVGLKLIAQNKGLMDMQTEVKLWLPFEEQEVISIQHVINTERIAFEIRVGKFGFTVAIQEHDELVLLRLNEYMIKLKVKFISLPHQISVKFHLDLELHGLAGDITAIEFGFKNVYGEQYQLIVNSNKDEHLNLHVGWKSYKVLTIATPKIYPGFIHVNFETNDYLNDYRVEVGIVPDSGFESENSTLGNDEEDLYDIYGFQIHQDIMAGGRHMRVTGAGYDSRISLGGTFALDSSHMNQSLLFELNMIQLGFEFLLEKHKGFFTDTYIEDIAFILPNQTLHWNTSAECNNRKLDLSSRFTWSEHDSEMPPITFKLNYDDNSLFGEKEHVLMVEFNHPENELLTLQGNLTKYYNTPMTALGEVIDWNFPDRNIVMNFYSEPGMTEGEHNLQLNISQSFSNFSLIFDASIVNSVFDQAEYSLKYWSLSEEQTKEVYVSTLLNSTENQFNFIFDVLAPEKNWGYSYEGMGYNMESLALFSFQGTSKEFNDYWVFKTTVNKHLPEFETKLQIGQEGEEPFETGRFRVGLHNPQEMGVVIDHERFDVWEQDAGIGLNLKTSSILQLLLAHDPSLDYMDDDFIARLSSPADQVWDAWKRDFNSTVSSVGDWGVAEMPAVFEALVNQETLQAIMEREGSNVAYLKIEFLTAISNIKEEALFVWTNVLVPAFEAVYKFIEDMTVLFLEYKAIVEAYVIEKGTEVLAWLDERLTEVKTYLMDVFEEQWNKIVDQYTQYQDHLSSKIMLISDTLVSAYTTIVENVTHMAQGVKMHLEAVLSTIQPYFDAVLESLTKYGGELSEILAGKCYESISTKAETLGAKAIEIADAGMTFFQEFLQIEATLELFTSFQNKLLEIINNLWTIIEGAAMKLQELFTGYYENLISFFDSNITLLNDTYNALLVKLETDGFISYMKEQIQAMKDRVGALYEDLTMFVISTFETFKASSAGNIIFEYVNAAAGNVYEQVMMVWNRWRTEDRNNIEGLERIAFSIADAAEKIFKENNYFLDELYIWKPEDYGRVLYHQLLPVKWNSFLETPDWHPLTRSSFWASPVYLAERSLMEGMHSIASGWNAFTLPGSMSPPFTATATIFGHHVTTFDLHHYQFLGSCTYLLTKDFVGHEFEVIGDYQRSEVGVISLYSLRVRTLDTDVVIFVRGDNAVSIKEKGPRVEVNSGTDYTALKTDDLLVTCNKVAQGCSITVSGKYFGRLGGLLGNYNYEPSDDSVGPDGSYARHSAELGRMWAVSSGSCYQKDQFIRVKDMEEANVDKCWNLFLTSSSPLSGCFAQVDPRPYFDHCIKGQNQPDFGQNIEKSPCDSVAAYRTQCSSQGIHLPTTDECQEVGGTCDVLGELVPSGWNSTFREKSIGSADVAFVVEIANCNQRRDITTLLDTLNALYQESGIVDVRYSLVLTNGNDVEVMTPFMAAESLAPKLKSRAMRGPSDPNGGDAAVISAARKLAWRPGVSRNIIQLSCKICTSMEDVEKAMRDNDVTYHLLSRDNPKIEGLDRRASKTLGIRIFGYDEKFVYTSEDFRELKGNAENRENVIDPKGSCIEATQRTNGAFFNSVKWNHNKRTMAAKFLNVMSQRVVQSSVSPECQECRCSGRGVKAALICRKCSSWNVEGANNMQEDETLTEEIRRKFFEFFHEKDTLPTGKPELVEVPEAS